MPGDLMCSVVSTVKNIVLETSRFLRQDLNCPQHKTNDNHTTF